MLLVRVRVDRSPIHGLGVFAAEPIARGTDVWRFTPGFDLEAHPALLYTLERHGVDIALRDLGEGEELTVDYRAIEEAP